MFLPRDAMHKRGLCRHAVYLCVCLSVCLSRSWVVSILEIFSPSGSHTILVFRAKRDGDIPTGTPLTGASNASGVRRNRDSKPICLLFTLQQARCCKWSPVDDVHHLASCDTYIAGRILRVFDHQKSATRHSHRLRGSSARERPSALSHYTQSW